MTEEATPWEKLMQQTAEAWKERCEKAETDNKILESVVSVTNTALNDLCAECIDEQGKPKAPDRRALMKARGILPSSYSQTLVKEKA